MSPVARQIKEDIGLHKTVSGSHHSKNIKPYKHRLDRTSPDTERINDAIMNISKGSPVEKSVGHLRQYASGIIDNTKRYNKVMTSADAIERNKDLINNIIAKYNKKGE